MPPRPPHAQSERPQLGAPALELVFDLGESQAAYGSSTFAPRAGSFSMKFS